MEAHRPKSHRREAEPNDGRGERAVLVAGDSSADHSY